MSVIRPLPNSDAALLFDIADRLERLERHFVRALGDRSNVSEVWLTKRQLAEHLGASVRWLEDRLAEGLPHREIAGKKVFRLPTVESWLARRGLLREVG